MATKNFTLIASIGAVAMLLLMGGIVFMLSKGARKRGIKAESSAAALTDARAKALAPTSSEDLQKQLEAQMAEQAALHAKREAEELMKLKIPAVSTKKTEVLTKHITTEAKKDPILMAQVIRSWLNGQDRR